MSYIRSGSNPEGLYVFESGSGLEFWRTDEKNIICKASVFKKFMKKLHKQDGYIDQIEPLRYKNISIQEVTVDITNKKKCKIFKKEISIKQIFDKKIKWQTCICLKIDNTKILMWTVTWNYFYNNYLNQELFL